MLLEKPKFLQASSNGTMYHYRVLHAPWNDLWALQHAKSNGTAHTLLLHALLLHAFLLELLLLLHTLLLLEHTLLLHALMLHASLLELLLLLHTLLLLELAAAAGSMLSTATWQQGAWRGSRLGKGNSSPG